MSQHDMVVDNGNGAVVLADMQAALQALATCQSGPVEPAAKYAGQFWLDTSGGGDGRLRQRNRNNTDWQQVIGMPAQATDADIAGFSDTTYLTPADVKKLRRSLRGYARNRIVNGAMQVSQENGDTASAVSGWYAADQWLTTVTLGGGGAVSFARVSSNTPRGSRKRLRFTVTTPQASLAAGDFACIIQRIEGLRLADSMFGLAAAKPVIVRFGFKGPAGTYSFGIRASGGVRSYVTNFTITAAQANTDTEQTFLIPGDTTGAWLNDTGIGMICALTLACGSTNVGAPNVWTAGQLLAGTGITNNVAAANIFELFDVGLYLDLDGSGTPPPWEFPLEWQQLQLCQRYYVQVTSFYSCQTIPAGQFIGIAHLPIDMRLAAFSVTQVSDLGASAFGTVSTLTALRGRAVRDARNGVGSNAVAYFQTLIAANARM